jgi:hypothetical protein
VGTGPGFNANLIRSSDAPYIANGLRIEKTGREILFRGDAAPVRDRSGRPRRSLEGDGGGTARPGAIATLDEYRKDPDFAAVKEEEATKGLSLYPAFQVRRLFVGHDGRFE